MSFANASNSPAAATTKNARRAGNLSHNTCNYINSRWEFASPNTHDAKTHRPTLTLRWSKAETL